MTGVQTCALPIWHLSNDGEKKAEDDKDKVDNEQTRMMDRLEKDFQLQEALNLLKAVDILKIEI